MPPRGSRYIDLSTPGDRMERLFSALHAFAAEHALPAPVIHDAHVALDELVSNIVRHGCGKRQPCRIAVQLRIAGGALVIHVRDEARPFNPLAAVAPDTTLPPHERPEGGLGILLVQRLMDDVRYVRRDGANRVVMKRVLARP